MRSLQAIGIIVVCGGDFIVCLSRHSLHMTQSSRNNVLRDATIVLLIFFVPTNEAEQLPSHQFKQKHMEVIETT